MNATNMSPTRRLADKFYDATIALSYGAPGYHLRHDAFADPDIDVDLSGKVVVVTGANAGLGFEVASGVVARGGTCAMVCRNPEKAERAKEELRSTARNERSAEVFLADLSSIEDTRKVADALLERFGDIDCLVNNAGVLLNERQESTDGHEVGYATNVLAGFILTHRLRPALAKAKTPRVVHVTSGGMYTQRLAVDSMKKAPSPYDGVQQYARTKRAQVVLNEMWRPILEKDGIVTTAMHPGWADTPGVQSSLPRFQKLMAPMLRSPQQGADTALWLAANERLAPADSGKLYFDREPRKTHYFGKTKETQSQRAKLWDVVTSDCGIDLPNPEDAS